MRSNPLPDFMEHAEWVRRLVASLVADPTLRDDVEQEVWLCALERPPRHARSLKGWLSRVARTASLQAWRRDGRRRRREELATPPHDPALATVDVVEVAELQRLVVTTVLQLEEPYRSSLLRRFVHGWTAEQIAEHDGVPASTVRNRWRRALARVRGRLDHELADDPPRRRALLALAAGDGGEAVAGSWVLGGWLMSVKLVSAVAVALILVAGAWRLHESAPDRSASVRPAAASQGDPTAVDVTSAAVAARVAAEASSPTEPSASDDGGSRSVRCRVTTTDDAPLADARVRVVEGFDTDERELGVGVTDEAGMAVIPVMHLGERPGLEASRDGYCRERRVVFDVDGVVEVQLAPAVRLFGRATHAESGAPWPDVAIAMTASEGEGWIREKTLTDAQGRFELTAPSGSRMRLSVDRDRYFREYREVDVGDTATEFPLPLVDAPLWRGRAVDATSGAPLADCAIERDNVPAGRTDSSGEFTLSLWERGQFDIFREGYSGTRVDIDSALIAGGAAEIPLVPAGRVCGLVRDERGAALQASVRSGVRGAIPWQAEWGARPGFVRVGFPEEWSCETDASGRYEIVGPPRGATLALTIHSAGFVPEAVTLTMEEDRVQRDFVMRRGGEVDGVVTRDSVPVSAYVQAVGASATVGASTDESGEFHIVGVEPGRVELRVRETRPPHESSQQEIDVRAGEATRCAVELGRRPMAMVTGTVRRKNGSPYVGAWLGVRGASGYRTRGTTDETGQFSIDVPADEPTVDVVASDRSVSTTRRGVTPGAAPIDLVLASPGSLRVKVLDEAGKLVPQFDVHWRCEPFAGAGYDGFDSFTGRARSPGADGCVSFVVRAGTIEVVVDAAPLGLGLSRASGEVPAEGVLDLTLVLPRAGDLQIRWSGDLAELIPRVYAVTLVPEEQVPGLRIVPQEGHDRLQFNRNLSIDVDRASPLPFRSAQYATPDPARPSVLRGVPAGRYELIAWPPLIRFDPSVIDVTAGGAEVVVRFGPEP